MDDYENLDVGFGYRFPFGITRSKASDVGKSNTKRPIEIKTCMLDFLLPLFDNSYTDMDE